MGISDEGYILSNYRAGRTAQENLRSAVAQEQGSIQIKRVSNVAAGLNWIEIRAALVIHHHQRVYSVSASIHCFYHYNSA